MRQVLKSFPQDLTFVARSTTLIKGLAARLGVRWSLADEWAPTAKVVLAKRGTLPSAAWGSAEGTPRDRSFRARAAYDRAPPPTSSFPRRWATTARSHDEQSDAAFW